MFLSSGPSTSSPSHYSRGFPPFRGQYTTTFPSSPGCTIALDMKWITPWCRLPGCIQHTGTIELSLSISSSCSCNCTLACVPSLFRVSPDRTSTAISMHHDKRFAFALPTIPKHCECQSSAYMRVHLSCVHDCTLIHAHFSGYFSLLF